ncbi:hypothetical protein [Spirobacillus cienkowskii]|uniref:hypothetical protein n=1 Tax=Spirobacillus cienkowskii TaxID=495820 RepID=UPI0030D334FA
MKFLLKYKINLNLLIIFFIIFGCKKIPHEYKLENNFSPIILSLNTEKSLLNKDSAIQSVHIKVTCEMFTITNLTIEINSEKNIFLPIDPKCTLELKSFKKNDLEYTSKNNLKIELEHSKKKNNSTKLYENSKSPSGIRVNSDIEKKDNILKLSFNFVERVEEKVFAPRSSIEVEKVDKQHTRIIITGHLYVALNTINFFSKDGTKKLDSQLINIATMGNEIILFGNKLPKCEFKNSNLNQNILYIDEKIHPSIKRFHKDSLSNHEFCAVLLKHTELEDNVVVEIILTHSESNTEKYLFSLF